MVFCPRAGKLAVLENPGVLQTRLAFHHFRGELIHVLGHSAIALHYGC